MPYAIAVQDGLGASVVLTSPLGVLLAGAGAGGFFSDGLCTVPISSTTISTSTSSTVIYFKSTVVQQAVLFVGSSTVPGSSASVTVSSVGKKVGFSSPSAYVQRNQCSVSPLQMRSLDENNVAYAAPSPITVTLGGASASAKFYADASCATASITTTVIGTGQTSASVYFKDSISESLALTATGSIAGWTVGGIAVTIYSPLAISPPIKTLVANDSLILIATGGVPPYVFTKPSGGGTLNAGTRTYAAPSTAGSATIRVTDSLSATSDSSLTIVTPVTIGSGTMSEHACSVFSNGTLQCWGRNDWGQSPA